MRDTIHRRELLLRCLSGAAGATWMSTRGAAAEPPATRPARESDAGQTLTLYPYEANVWVRVNDRPLVCYRTNPELKAPYFYPLVGPATGLSMTEEAGDPYPHHRSVFFGCDQVNGLNFWQEGNNRGQIVSRGPKALPVAVQSRSADLLKATKAIISDVCDWRAPGKPPIIEDRRHFVVWAPSPELRLLDASIVLKALVDIHVGKTNHSLFAIRCARELAPAGGGRLVNSKGQEGEKGTLGEPAKWCGFQGTRMGATESIVLMDHPNNPWTPTCPWFTRSYGFMSPTPFNWLEKGWDLPKGQAVRLMYRIAVIAGAIEPDRINALWDAFAETTQQPQ